MEEAWSSVHNTGPRNPLLAPDNGTEMRDAADCRRAARGHLLTRFNLPLYYTVNHKNTPICVRHIIYITGPIVIKSGNATFPE